MTVKALIRSEITSDSLLHLLFLAKVKRDHLITDFKGADSSVNCRFLDGLR